MDRGEWRELRAGPLSLVLDGGDLRYVRAGGHEIIRRLYVAVRDRDWNTLPAALSNLQVAAAADTFRVEYDAEHRQNDIDFVWHASIEGDAAGTIRFHMAGLARSTFLRNRIGICVLHPMEYAGQPCVVEHTDGSREDGSFPSLISPHQVFREMRAISHQVAPDLWAEVRMEGDVFEMEDQRNWTDGSYKTYCTPLDLPFPIVVAAGTRIEQHVTITIRGTVPPDTDQHEPLAFRVGNPTGRMVPRIGLGMASHWSPLSPAEYRILQTLGLAHLRVDLRLSDPAYPSYLRQAAVEAAALDVELEVALFLSDAADHELATLCDLLDELRPPVCTWLIFHTAEKSTTARWVQLARDHVAGFVPTAKIGAGTNAYFAELNRGRPSVDHLDLVSYSINPQVHAFDDASLVEALAAQAVTVESARAFCGELPIAVSPVTLRPRFNPNATSSRSSDGDESNEAVDPRQHTLFAAGWTLGSLKYLSESGIYSATYYETTGRRGIMEHAGGSPGSGGSGAEPRVFPVFHVLADVCDFAGGMIVATTSSDPLLIDGLAIRRGDATRVLVANLDAEPHEVHIAGLPDWVRLQMLDANSLHEAQVSPVAFRDRPGELKQAVGGELTLVLLPHAIARLDSIQSLSARGFEP